MDLARLLPPTPSEESTLHSANLAPSHAKCSALFEKPGNDIALLVAGHTTSCCWLYHSLLLAVSLDLLYKLPAKTDILGAWTVLDGLEGQLYE